MEREILFSGIGGQGIQLAAKSLAYGAIADGYRVQMSSSYGGMMRGGNSESALVVGTATIEAPPTVTSAWAGFVMHAAHAASVFAAVRPGGLVVVNSSVVSIEALPVDPAYSIILVPALDEAAGLGAPMAASLVLAGAFVAATGLVTHGSLVRSADSVLPSYRADAAAANARALARGLELAERVVEAWGGADVVV